MQETLKMVLEHAARTSRNFRTIYQDRRYALRVAADNRILKKGRRANFMVSAFFYDQGKCVQTFCICYRPKGDYVLLFDLTGIRNDKYLCDDVWLWFRMY